MVRDDYFNHPDNLPDYYDTMYMDGFDPWQIMVAHHRTMIKEIEDEREQPEDYNINFKSDIKVNK